MDLFKLLPAPADTTAYYIAGYAVFFTVMTIYLASFHIRYRNLNQEYEILIELDRES